MSKAAEVEKLARLALSRQAETDMRVDAVEARAEEAADAGGRTSPGQPAAASSLDGLYGWRPEAFSVWFTTGGGGEVGVCYPEKCVSYGGEFVGDDVLNCSVHEDPDTKFRWCEPGKPSEKEPKLVLTLVRRDEDEDEGGVKIEEGEGGGFAMYLEWVESADDAKAAHGEANETVLACVPIAEYDAKLDRLSQVHVGVLALGGGEGGGGGSSEPLGDERSVCRAAAPYGTSTVNILQLCGFGKFTTEQSLAEYGSFTASDEYDIGDVIDRDMRAKTGDDGLALVVRSGNTNTVDANTVGYKTLTYSPIPTPFQVVVDRGQDQAGHEIITGRHIEAGVVYDGVREVTVAPLQNVPDTGTVYLTATRAAGEGRWGNFKLDTKPAAPETGEALNVKLYDFAQGKVEMDYRTTFLTLPSGGGGSVDADDISIGFDGGKLEIHDFHDSTKSVDNKTLAQRLAEDRMPAATEYQLLARAPGKPNSLGYIPLGSLEPPYKAGDGIQIDPKESDGKRKISCTVTVPGVDGKSLDANPDGKRQIKGWHNAAASGNTLAADLMGSATPADLVLVKSGENLAYKAIGRITGTGWSGTVYCDKLTWSGSSLSRERQTLTFTNGLLTSTEAGVTETLFSTVAHSTLHPEF